jgi:hypothetical protein
MERRKFTKKTRPLRQATGVFAGFIFGLRRKYEAKTWLKGHGRVKKRDTGR